MGKTNWEDEKLKMLKDYLQSETKAISGAQFSKLLLHEKFFTFQQNVAKMCSKYIHQLKVDEVFQILKSFEWDDDSLKGLELIADTMINVDEEGIQKIESKYKWDDDKQKARYIIENAEKRNCIYGKITEKVATFLIDVSPSMEYTFRLPNG